MVDDQTVDLAVVGPGSVGAYFAAHAAQRGTSVLACARRPFDEFVIDSERFPARLRANVLIDPSAVARPVPHVLVALKSQHTAEAGEWLRRLCGPETIVVAAQNGLEAEERLAPFVNGATVVQSVVYCTAELVAPGHVQHYSSGWLWVPNTPEMQRFAQLFAGSGAEIRPTDSYVTELWRKLGFNTTTNGVTALARKRLAAFAREDMALLGTRLLAEAWTVARALGADLDPTTTSQYMTMIAEQPGNPGTSTYYDRMAGRPTEHDAIYGSMVRAARRIGIEVPVTETVWALLAAGDDDRFA
jgi:2-dehydropantoate 2-reductase